MFILVIPICGLIYDCYLNFIFFMIYKFLVDENNEMVIYIGNNSFNM